MGGKNLFLLTFQLSSAHYRARRRDGRSPIGIAGILVSKLCKTDVPECRAPALTDASPSALHGASLIKWRTTHPVSVSHSTIFAGLRFLFEDVTIVTSGLTSEASAGLRLCELIRELNNFLRWASSLRANQGHLYASLTLEGGDGATACAEASHTMTACHVFAKG